MTDQELQRCNATAVLPAELASFARELETPRGQTIDGFLDTMLSRFGDGYDKGLSILHRITALARLLREGDKAAFRGMPAEHLFTVAAAMDLRREGEDLVFDEAAFIQRLRRLPGAQQAG